MYIDEGTDQDGPSSSTTASSSIGQQQQQQFQQHHQLMMAAAAAIINNSTGPNNASGSSEVNKLFMPHLALNLAKQQQQNVRSDFLFVCTIQKRQNLSLFNWNKLNEFVRRFCEFLTEVTYNSSQKVDSQGFNSIPQSLSNTNEIVKLKPFSCHKCERTFSTKYNVIRHLRQYHAERRMFRCDVCGRDYKWVDSLNKHKKLHGDCINGMSPRAKNSDNKDHDYI